MCNAFLPVAARPLWQLKQLPVTPLWLKFAGRHATVVWQLAQLSSDWMWLADFGVIRPALVRCVPPWHDTQVPDTCA